MAGLFSADSPTLNHAPLPLSTSIYSLQKKVVNYLIFITQTNTMKHLITFGIFLFVIGACSRPPERAILGKWLGMDTPETVEFFLDGTVLCESVNTNHDKGNISTGKYSILDATRLKVEFSGNNAPNGPRVYSFSIKGGELELGNPDSGDRHFERTRDVTSKQKNAIIGKWQISGEQGSIEFLPNGVGTIDNSKPIRYKFLDDGLLMYEFSDREFVTSLTFRVYVNNDRTIMTLINGNGIIIRARPVK